MWERKGLFRGNAIRVERTRSLHWILTVDFIVTDSIGIVRSDVAEEKRSRETSNQWLQEFIPDITTRISHTDQFSVSWKGAHGSSLANSRLASMLSARSSIPRSLLILCGCEFWCKSPLWPCVWPLMTTVATKCSKEACDWVGRVSQRVVAWKKVYSSRQSKEGKVLIFSLVSVLVILKSCYRWSVLCRG